MNLETNREIDLRTASTEEVTAAMVRGVRAALEMHKESNRSIVVWDWDNRCVETVPPDQIEVPASPAETPAPHTGAVEHPAMNETTATAPHHS